MRYETTRLCWPWLMNVPGMRPTQRMKVLSSFSKEARETISSKFIKTSPRLGSTNSSTYHDHGCKLDARSKDLFRELACRGRAGYIGHPLGLSVILLEKGGFSLREDNTPAIGCACRVLFGNCYPMCMHLENDHFPR